MATMLANNPLFEITGYMRGKYSPGHSEAPSINIYEVLGELRENIITKWKLDVPSDWPILLVEREIFGNPGESPSISTYSFELSEAKHHFMKCSSLEELNDFFNTN